MRFDVQRAFVRVLISGICAGFWVNVALAGEMVTDRPDATESSSVVEPGYIQAELGWLYTKEGDLKAHHIPQTLFRIGVLERVELRLGWSGYQNTISGDGASNWGDFELGAKVYLVEERRVRPEIALMGGVSIPSGSDGVSRNEIDPSFRFAFSHTLSEIFSLGYNLGAEWATEDDSTESSFVYTAALGMGLSEKLGSYIEFFGDIGMSASGVAHSFDGGFTYLLRENLQLDLFAGVGLSDDAEDWFTGSGVSFRFPN